VKTASFTVRATMPQSIRWKRAAEAESYSSVGSWAASALDAYLEHRSRAGRPLPLAWRLGRFRVALEDGTEPEVRGWIARPFGVFRGDPTGPRCHGTHIHTLIFLPTRQPVATFRYARYCRTLAAELTHAILRRELPDPAPIIDRHQRESV
jgi:hypothetical protein